MVAGLHRSSVPPLPSPPRQPLSGEYVTTPISLRPHGVRSPSQSNVAAEYILISLCLYIYILAQEIEKPSNAKVTNPPTYWTNYLNILKDLN